MADLDLDGKPEVVTVHNANHTMAVWRYGAAQASKFTLVRGPVDINGMLNPSLCPVGNWGNLHGGGSPTIADFNGEGTPDVGVGHAFGTPAVRPVTGAASVRARGSTSGK